MDMTNALDHDHIFIFRSRQNSNNFLSAQNSPLHCYQRAQSCNLIQVPLIPLVIISKPPRLYLSRPAYVKLPTFFMHDHFFWQRTLWIYLFIALERIWNPTRNLEEKLKSSSIIMATSRISLYCSRTHRMVIRLQESLVIKSWCPWHRADIHRHTQEYKISKTNKQPPPTQTNHHRIWQH